MAANTGISRPPVDATSVAPGNHLWCRARVGADRMRALAGQESQPRADPEAAEGLDHTPTPTQTKGQEVIARGVDVQLDIKVTKRCPRPELTRAPQSASTPAGVSANCGRRGGARRSLPTVGTQLAYRWEREPRSRRGSSVQLKRDRYSCCDPRGGTPQSPR
jgi:hypothetical protein